MSKILRTAAGARGNFMIGDAETPTTSTRVILEALIDMKFILTDNTGELARRFYYHSLQDVLKRNGGDLGGEWPDLVTVLARAEKQHGDLARWDFFGGRAFNLLERAEYVGMKDDYDLYRKLSNTIHSSFME